MDTRTYVSLNNGNNFVPLEFNDEDPECDLNKCRVELHLKCSIEFIRNSFPGYRTVQIEGTFYKNDVKSSHTFISLNGGQSWKMLDTRIEKVTIVNNGELIVALDKTNGKIWYSYNEGVQWKKEKLNAYNCLDIILLQSPINHVIAGINYNEKKNIYTIFLLKYKRATSMGYVITDKICEGNDFENWYVPRYHGNCFQGEEIYYLQKKHYAMCYDDRSSSQPTTNPCPCSIEDFPW
ncbi:Vacuolar protein sorting/targeting protein 10 [Thelohanellus kitauei]|uniref:Vacuolar protein sorting/targeting protein 10 n=1 Tax=Thelohanellus kitauei TaxID=669202 RepID=A0A0C2IE06_THEKT|nr:Vacuolar protein sorting/targeting protein 10 [Thelohanellus kitauei]